MKNKQKIALVAILLLLIGIVVFLMLRRKGAEEISLSNTLAPTPARDDSFPLSMGSRGENVKKLQTKMNMWMLVNYNDLATKPKHQYGVDAGLPMKEILIDGIFGQNTREFVRTIFGVDSVSEFALTSLSY